MVNKQLYEEYGAMTIQFKIVQGRLLELEKRIAEEINAEAKKPQVVASEKKDKVKEDARNN
jgi:hypothetical protein